MRILVFEDTYDIFEMISNFQINLEHIEFKQYWDTKEAIERISEFNPDILLLDYYISPKTGLQVLQDLNIDISHKIIERPKKIIGISSSSTANFKFLQFGADESVIKFELEKLGIWENLKK
tara:strand:- start:805 stop:1167 length:363 start_codon:yes stop_codon:yes gene_type:complete